jgi:alginate O-acetyltransferase complex protein AlgI
VFFRATTFSAAWAYLRALVGAAEGDGPPVTAYLTIHVQLALVVGTLAAVVPWREWLPQRNGWRAVSAAASFRLGIALAELTLFVGSLLSVAGGTYNPFIYFRF